MPQEPVKGLFLIAEAAVPRTLLAPDVDRRPSVDQSQAPHGPEEAEAGCHPLTD